MKCSLFVFLICVAVVVSTVLVQPGVRISWQDGLQVRFETPDVHAAGSNGTNDLIGDLVVFSQDYTNTGTVPSNMCLALDSLSGHVENETLSYNGTSHCVELDATEGAVGQLFVGGLSPSLSTSTTLDMGMGRTEDHATVNVFAGGAWLAIRLSNGTPTDDLVITSYYYSYSNPTLHYATNVTPNVGFSGSGRFEITIASNCVSKTNTIYLNDVEKLTTPFTRYKPYELAPFYDPFVNPFIYFEVSSIYSGQTAYLQLYSIEQTVPEYGYVTPISNPRLISFGLDGPHAWDTVDTGLSLLDHGTIWADVKYIDDYSPSELAALKALIADGFELGIHFSSRLSDLPLEEAIALMDTETASITAIFGEAPTSWCSLQGADDIEHAEHAYTNLGMVSRNGVNGSAGGLSQIGNLGDNCWNFWSSASAAGIVIPSFSHELDVTPAIAWSISPANFSTFVSNYASNGIQIVGLREYWEKAQNSYHTDISNIVCEPAVSLSFTVENIGGKSRLLVNAPWANAVRDSSGANVPFEAYGSGIVVEVEDGDYTVAAVGAAPRADFSADKTAVVVGQTIQFTDLSTGGVAPLTYQWDFDNSGTWDNTTQNPSYSYSSAGIYTVVLKVTDAALNTDNETKANHITVATGPLAAFGADRTAVVVGQNVTFTNSSSGGVAPLTYQWDFDNSGTWDNTTQNPSYSYSAAGTYTVVLKVTDAALNTDNETKTNYITVTTAPVADFSADKVLVALGQSIKFTNLSGGGVGQLTYQWDFNNDGTWDSTAQSPSYTYGSAGTYKVVLRVTDAATNTDTETKANYIRVNQAPNPPTNSLPVNLAIDISLTPVLQSSAFNDPGDTHTASQWQITTTSGNYSSPVFDSATDPLNLAAIATPLLNYSTTYYWHVRYQDDHGAWSSWSAETSFSTSAARVTAPSVVTSDASNVATTSATLNGDLARLGTASSVTVSFVWGISSGSYPNETAGQAKTAPGTFYFDLDSLTPGTTYYYQAKAIGNGTVYGVEKSFTTGQRPVVEDVDPSNGKRKQHLRVTISGSNFDGATIVSFGSGITVEDFSVNSSTEITAEITIDADATKGARNVSLTTGWGTATKIDGFSVVGGGGGVCSGGATATPGVPSEMTTTLAALGILFGVGYLLVRRGTRNRRGGVRA